MAQLTYLESLAESGIKGAHPGGLALTRILLRTENIRTGMRLLDVGCGTGQTAAYIAGHYPCSVTAVDINPIMLEKARRNFAHHPDIVLIKADAMDLPFQKNSFDMILAESVTVFTRIAKSLREYYRVLKPGGILLAIEATALSPLSCDETAIFKRVLGIEWMPTVEEWRQMFQEAGFPNPRVLSLRHMNWIQSFSPWMKQTCARAQALREYAAILRRYRSKFGYGVYRAVKNEV